MAQGGKRQDDMREWFDAIDDRLKSDTEGFARHFFTGKIKNKPDGVKVNPCPYCGHNDCFHVNHHGFVKCFSAGCEIGDRGVPMAKAVRLLTGDRWMEELESFTGIRRPEYKPVTPERQLEIDRDKRIEIMCNLAVDMYHEELLQNEQALRKQTGNNLADKERGHSVASLKHFKVGFCDVGTWAEINRKLSAEGYSRDDIQVVRKRVWVPPGNFVYPCFSERGHVKRLNTKMFFRSCYGPPKDEQSSGYERCDFRTFDLSKEAQEKHERECRHKMVNVFSAGEKEAFFVSPADMSRRNAFKWGVLVEGENDAISLWEALQGTKYERKVLVIAVCGQVSEDLLNQPYYAYIRKLERIFEAFDHDHAGVAYREKANIVYTEIPYFTLEFGADDSDGDDIDAFLKREKPDKETIERLFEDAHPILPNKEAVRIEMISSDRSLNNHPVHVWSSENRKGKIIYRIKNFKGRGADRKQSGDVELYKGKSAQASEIKLSTLLHTLRVDDHLNPLKMKLIMHLQTYYEEFPTSENGTPLRPEHEILTAYHFSVYQNVLHRQLATLLLQEQEKQDSSFDEMADRFKSAVGSTKFELITSEMNALVNGTLKPEQGVEYPMIQLSSHFDTERNVAFYYFVKTVKDGDAIAAVPCLISNRKNETRLDIIKRKEETHMLLVEGRYQIPSEMKAVPLPAQECSLQAEYVERWKEGGITDEEIDPARLIREIEEVIRTVYYFEDQNVPKVLSLWVYGTYYYTLFGAYPYIEITGRKGSGKSTIDTILTALSLNGRMSAHSTGAAIYRMLNLVGGTLVLDEMESLSDKAKNDASDMGPILKAGYSASSGAIYRMNMEAGEAQNFAVYSPKVISSINGIDDVLRDRSILITTKPAPEQKRDKLLDISLFSKGDRLRQVRSIASRCAISALTHFMTVEEKYREIQLESGANRLGQIVLPLQTIASIADAEYDTALTEYYETELKAYKQYTAENTLEGRMVLALRGIAREVTGLVDENDKVYTVRYKDTDDKEMYKRDIIYSKESGMFEVTTIHLRLILDSMGDGEVTMKDIHTQARMLLGTQSRAGKMSNRTSYSINNETLSKMFHGKTRLGIYKFSFRIQDYLDPDDYEKVMSNQTKLEIEAPPF